MKLKLLVLILALQSAWILGTTVVQEHGLASGTLVLLETRPVDPRDLIRGDYITLNYKISDVELSAFSPPQTNALTPGATVYVALEPHGRFYEVAKASSSRIVPTNNQVVLRGRVLHWWSEKSTHLEYGLERYYVPEGKGRPSGKITVQAAVPASGRAQIKELFVDGKPFAQVMKDAAGP